MFQLSGFYFKSPDPLSSGLWEVLDLQGRCELLMGLPGCSVQGFGFWGLGGFGV